MRSPVLKTGSGVAINVDSRATGYDRTHHIPYGRLLDVFVLDMRSYRAGNSYNRQPAPGPIASQRERSGHQTFTTISVIRQNYGIALGVNAGGIAIGALGFLNPFVAAALHNLSTLLVVFNSARLIRYDPDEPQHRNGTRTKRPLNEKLRQNGRPLGDTPRTERKA